MSRGHVQERERREREGECDRGMWGGFLFLFSQNSFLFPQKLIPGTLGGDLIVTGGIEMGEVRTEGAAEECPPSEDERRGFVFPKKDEE